MSDKTLLEKIVSLAKRRGFYYPGSELYGGLANTYDYGPLGAELMRNIRNVWWKNFVHDRSDIVGLDASIISHHRIWEASGHTAGFSDAMVDCRNCRARYRADHLIEEYLEQDETNAISSYDTEAYNEELITAVLKTKKVEGLSEDYLDLLIEKLQIPCPKCGEVQWTPVRKFNLLFPVTLGIVEGDQSLAYLRGETAQGMFVNFKNVVDSTRVRLPFGIAQLGKSFRNEITLGNSIFRTIEFEQGEIEYFFNPETDDWEKLFEQWKNAMWGFVQYKLGVKEENLRWRVHTDEERSFYSKRTEDLEYNFPFGFKELWGIAYRTDYDLSQHEKFSGQELRIDDPKTGQKVLPYVIEPAVGINRLMLMVLVDAYSEAEDGRVVLKLHPSLAPFKVAVFPLLANKEELVTKAKEIFEMIKPHCNATWDDRGNIGKRYAAQDEAGTPHCVTIDFDTLQDNTVTIRDRDTAKQERVEVKELLSTLHDRIDADDDKTR